MYDRQAASTETKILHRLEIELSCHHHARFFSLSSGDFFSTTIFKTISTSNPQQVQVIQYKYSYYRNNSSQFGTCIDPHLREHQQSIIMSRTITNRYIRVVAPETLEENFTFDILVGGQPVTVVVPSGGVTEGEEFEVPYPPHLDDEDEERSEGDESGQDNDSIQQNDENDENDKAPHGQFRVSLLSCCDVVTQATFWLGFCCLPVLLAQVLTRLGMKWNGQETQYRSLDGERDEYGNDQPLQQRHTEKDTTFNKIVLALVGALTLGHIPVVGTLVVFLFYLVMMVWIGGNLRRYMRQRYSIPSKVRVLPGGLEDRCTMCCCGCCAVIQMARHTHDDKNYPGSCCTTTGL
jgi:Cys-rich protein (TIGR01571 family)